MWVFALCGVIVAWCWPGCKHGEQSCWLQCPQGRRLTRFEHDECALRAGRGLEAARARDASVQDVYERPLADMVISSPSDNVITTARASEVEKRTRKPVLSPVLAAVRSHCRMSAIPPNRPSTTAKRAVGLGGDASRLYVRCYLFPAPRAGEGPHPDRLS